MKKLITVSVVLLSLTMTGCLVEDNSVEIAELKREIEELKEENITTQEKTDLFEKNLKCQSLKSDIEKKLEEIDAEYTGNDYLESVFYSSTKNTCLVVTRQEDVLPGHTYKFLYTMENLDFTEEGILECEEVSIAKAQLEFFDKNNSFLPEEYVEEWSTKIDGCEKFNSEIERLKNE